MLGQDDFGGIDRNELSDIALEQTTLCRCGSGEERYALNDARGIFCSYVCSECEDEVKAKYRPEIFEDSMYEADEPIDTEPEY